MVRTVLYICVGVGLYVWVQCVNFLFNEVGPNYAILFVTITAVLIAIGYDFVNRKK